MTGATWQVRVQGEATTDERAHAAEAVPLKWANDARTGEPRYIHDDQVVSRLTHCLCRACGNTLTPVLAGEPRRVKPTAHFRHPDGAPKGACALVAARLAATRHLLEMGVIELPRRRMSATAVGFSGQGYEGWAEAPAERVAIASARLSDHVTAELTLDDGRTLLVDLTGTRTAGADGGGRAVVTIDLSDPELARMDIDEIRSRLRLLPSIAWCSHWHDTRLSADAEAASVASARSAFDAWDKLEEQAFRALLPAGTEDGEARLLRRETLLHRLVKSILQEEKRIKTPSLRVSEVRHAPEGYAEDWTERSVELDWWSVEHDLKLADVVLERGLGSIVPDVRAKLDAPLPRIVAGVDTTVRSAFDEDRQEAVDEYPWPWKEDLLVEVAVTHRVDGGKLRRIQDLDIPTLELDLGLLGGRVTREGLKHLVVDGLHGKRWIHHPILRAKRRQLRREIADHAETRAYEAFEAEQRRPSLLGTPAEEWARRYVAAITTFHDANTAISRARRSANQRHLELLDSDSDEWQAVALAGEALAAHDLAGALDDAMANSSGIVARILSIKLNRGVGYALGTAYQVLNAIWQGSDGKRWGTLYAVAVKTYDAESHFNETQLLKYRAWLNAIRSAIEAEKPDPAYFRPPTYDGLLSVLFPEMAARLARGYGRAPAFGEAS